MDQLISGVHPAAAVAVTGISEALDTRLRSGQLVVATRIAHSGRVPPSASPDR